IWALLAGSGFYYLCFQPAPPLAVDPVHIGSAWQPISFTIDIDLNVLISLLFCFIALMANDVGSIQTTASLLNSTGTGKKTKRGLIFTGLGNALAGMFGVLGPVNYSLSTGVIISSRCASRYPLIAAAVAMIVLACIPAVISAMSYIPPIVVGTILFYMLCSQISGGIGVLSPYLVSFRYETGIVIGMPMLLATCIAFLPTSVAETIPLLWRPLLTNGFVVGVIAAIVLEKLLLPEKRM
ncbi:MAG: solute carrier family 23 protein, partial [Sporomusa sp.]